MKSISLNTFGSYTNDVENYVLKQFSWIDTSCHALTGTLQPCDIKVHLEFDI